MQLCNKVKKIGSRITYTMCDLVFHPRFWGCGISGGQEPIGAGFMIHSDFIFRIIFLCWTFEIVREIFEDEDGLVEDDRSILW
jgi:hypothetical protein